MRQTGILVVLALCVLIGHETRQNHRWLEEKMEAIHDEKRQEVYHPLALVATPFRMYGYSVMMMNDDKEASRYWFVMRNRFFYAPILINYYLYPEQQVCMAASTQREFLDDRLFGVETAIHHKPPARYDKIISVSFFHTEFIERDMVE